MPGQLFFLAIYCNKKLVTNVTFYVSTKIYINFSIQYYIKWQSNEESRTTKALENGLHVDQKNKVYIYFVFF